MCIVNHQRPILSQEKPEHDVLGNDHQETQKDQKRFTTFQVHAVINLHRSYQLFHHEM